MQFLASLVLSLLLVSPVVAQTVPAPDVTEQVRQALLEVEGDEGLTPAEFDAFVADIVADYADSGLTLDEYFGEDDLDGFTTEDGLTSFGNLSCFDQYQFNSVGVNLTTGIETALPGTSITVSGVVTNTNPYPVVDGTLYVKVFRMPGGTTDITANGPDVIDQFAAVSDIAIPANGTTPVSFTWTVPTKATAGQYAFASFFATSDRYNLLGLSFTDDVVGNTLPFTITSRHTAGVYLDKSTVTVNGEPYFFAAYPPRTDAAAPVVVAAELVNDTATAVTVPVRALMYEWDALRAENRVDIDLKTITVPAGSRVPVTFETAASDYPVYLLEMIAGYEDTKSILNVRFVRTGLNVPRINFPSLTTFPLEANTESAVFSCLHTVGEGLTDVRLKLVLTDRDGNIITTTETAGQLPPDMSGVISRFTPEQSYDFLVLDAELYHNGTLVEAERIVYDCEDIDDGSCLPEATTPVSKANPGGSVHWLWFGGFVAVGIILVALATTYLVSRRREEDVMPLDTHPDDIIR